MFLVFFIAAGDPAPAVNEAHYLCRLKHFWDPAWCRGDLFLDSPDAHFTVVWLFGWVTRWWSLEATAWLGRLLSWGLLAVAWTRLVRRVTPLPFLPALGGGLLAYGSRQLGFAGEWIVGGFEAKSLAYGFVLWALADALDGRWNRSAVLVGVATALHALVGGWFGLALAIAAIATGQAPPIGRVAPGALAGLALASVGVAPALWLNSGTPAEVVSEANQAYVFYRLPHHLAPLSKGPLWLAEHAAPHGLLVAGLGALALGGALAGRPELRLVVCLAWVAEGISLTGLAVEGALGTGQPALAASLLKYYWFRLADVVTPLAAALVLMARVDALLRLRPARGALLAAGLLVVGGWHLGSVVSLRTTEGCAPADRMMTDPADWVAMCEWVAENTPEDAVFLVPHGAHTFKWRTGRAEVVTYKDVPQDASSMVEWRRRRTEVFQDGFWEDGTPRWTPSLAAIGATRLRELGERYGAAYALDETPPPDPLTGRVLRKRASLPVRRRIGAYTLYELGPVGNEAGASREVSAPFSTGGGVGVLLSPPLCFRGEGLGEEVKPSTRFTFPKRKGPLLEGRGAPTTLARPRRQR